MSTNEVAQTSLTKENIEILKLREELKSSKQQRLLAILGAVGTVIAFLLTNTDKISNLIFHNPRVQVVMEDDYLKKNGQLKLLTRDANGTVVVSDSLSTLPKWFSLNPGPYHLTITAFGESVYEMIFTVDKRDVRTIVIPAVPAANIRVAVENQTGHVGPGTQLDLQIESSGNGYVWVFQKNNDRYDLIYPLDCPTNCGNEITVSQGFHLPDQSHRTIFAGMVAGEERLTFFVTSSPNVDSARKLAGHFANASIAKASGGIAKDNWGYAELSYEILPQQHREK
jgi:hypothetical protein